MLAVALMNIARPRGDYPWWCRNRLVSGALPLAAAASAAAAAASISRSAVVMLAVGLIGLVFTRHDADAPRPLPAAIPRDAHLSAHPPTPCSAEGWFFAAVKKARAIDKTFPTSITPHSLRHAAASLAVSAGANVKALQKMLGHKAAAMTLDTYADLFDDDLNDVAVALDNAKAKSDVGKMWAAEAL